MSAVHLIGLDTGLANFGVAVADVSTGSPRFQFVEVWTTKPGTRKRRLRKSDDTAERCQELARKLHAILADVRPVAICVEAVALPFGRCRSSVVSALGRVRGLVDALAEVHGLPVLEETPQRLKLAVGGRADLSKADVRFRLDGTHPELATMWPERKTLVEHAADACAAVVACRSADVVLAALRAIRTEIVAYKPTLATTQAFSGGVRP